MSETGYKVVNGTSYHESAPDAVVDVLESVRSSRKRIRVRLGDVVTGRDWLEKHDVDGYVSRSMGPVKIPILVHNRRSSGGGGLLDNCVVKIIDIGSKTVLYVHPKYHLPKLTIGKPDNSRVGSGKAPPMVEAVYADGKLHAQFVKSGAAARWIKRMSL